MKMKADLKQIRDQEKEMWNAVNEKRDVRFKYCYATLKYEYLCSFE